MRHLAGEASMEVISSTVQVELDDGGIRFGLADQEPTWLHPFWLRERAKGQGMVDPVNGQRFHGPSTYDPRLAITAIRQDTPDKIDLIFNDGVECHVLMKEVCIELGMMPDPQSPTASQLWDGALSPRPEVSWNNLHDPAVLKLMLEGFFQRGFCIIHDTPTTPGSLKTIAEKFGYVRETNFGVLFDVKKKQNASDLAYTNGALAAHTDNPYRIPIPGIQFLHCLENSVAGGLSKLADGFAIAHALEEEAPDQAKILSTANVRFRYEALGGAIMQNWGPIIERDMSGKLVRIRLSSRLDFVEPLPAKELELFYAARCRFQQLADDPAFEIRQTFEPGMLLMMDNHRILHGRTEYEAGTGHRHLQGCYIDHDGPDSLYRMLVRDGMAMVMRDVE